MPGTGAACHGFTAWQADMKWSAKADPSDGRDSISDLAFGWGFEGIFTLSGVGRQPHLHW